MDRHVATFWYLSTDNPAALFTTGTRSDPGFARRLLSRLHPTVTVASLGTFPLNRSATAGPGEIYIGSFPGLTVVQTPLDGPVLPSRTDKVWLKLVEAPVVLAFSHDPETGVHGFARWESGELVRSFAAADDRIVEDEGIPQPFERPYWAGEFPLEGADDNPLALPFSSSALLHAAHRAWLDFDLERGGLDVPVDGFATDGRREVRQHTPTGPAFHLAGMPGRAERNAAARREAGDDPDDVAGDSPYDDDDYERIPHPRRRTSRRLFSGFGASAASSDSGDTSGSGDSRDPGGSARETLKSSAGQLAGRLSEMARRGADKLREAREARRAEAGPVWEPDTAAATDSDSAPNSDSAPAPTTDSAPAAPPVSNSNSASGPAPASAPKPASASDSATPTPSAADAPKDPETT